MALNLIRLLDNRTRLPLRNELHSHKNRLWFIHAFCRTFVVNKFLYNKFRSIFKKKFSLEKQLIIFITSNLGFVFPFSSSRHLQFVPDYNNWSKKVYITFISSRNICEFKWLDYACTQWICMFFVVAVFLFLIPKIFVNI